METALHILVVGVVARLGRLDIDGGLRRLAADFGPLGFGLGGVALLLSGFGPGERENVVVLAEGDVHVDSAALHPLDPLSALQAADRGRRAHRLRLLLKAVLVQLRHRDRSPLAGEELHAVARGDGLEVLFEAGQAAAQRQHQKQHEQQHQQRPRAEDTQRHGQTRGEQAAEHTAGGELLPRLKQRLHLEGEVEILQLHPALHQLHDGGKEDGQQKSGEDAQLHRAAVVEKQDGRTEEEHRRYDVIAPAHKSLEEVCEECDQGPVGVEQADDDKNREA